MWGRVLVAVGVGVGVSVGADAGVGGFMIAHVYFTTQSF